MNVKQRITVEELWEMPEVPGKTLELVDGEVIEVPPGTALHGLIVGQVLSMISAFIHERDLGLAFGDGTGYVLRHPDLMRIPDVSFVSWDRVPEDGITDQGYMPMAPDLVVEIVSPGDRANEIREKVDEYLETGVRAVWVLWPKRRAVSVHRPGAPTLELGPDDELDGSEVLPGFRIRVCGLFNVRTKR